MFFLKVKYIYSVLEIIINKTIELWHAYLCMLSVKYAAAVFISVEEGLLQRKHFAQVFHYWVDL